MAQYHIKQVLKEGALYVLDIEGHHTRYTGQLWSIAKMRKHKNARCAICTKVVGAVAYRPVGNAANRMFRICTTCMERS